MREKSVFKGLNKAQQEAVQAGHGPVLVVAGAGTGKTSVIIERICRLLAEGTSAKRILALTFTEKAAAEMRDRINLALGTYEIELPILTFNAFGENLLRRHSADIGLGRNFTVMGESARIVFLRERIDELGLDYFAPLSSPDALLGDVADYFSLLKQHVITPDIYQAYAAKLPKTTPAEKLEHKKQSELAGAYAAFIRLCREANVVDYDDQIYLLIDLFRQRPNVLETIQASYDYIMVDEFQDTNVMQSVLIDMVSAPRQNLFVVGDDDQSIYGWRGATLANILDFKQRYPRAKDVSLVQNYRSTRQILDCAYHLIRHNNPHRLEEKLKISKRLRTEKTGTEPAVLTFADHNEELTWVAEDIKRRLDSGTPPGHIAIMARRNSTTQLVHNHLDFMGVEHIVAGERYELYRHPSVRMLLEALKATVDPLDSTSLYHTLSSPLFSVSAGRLSAVAAGARRHHEPLMQVIANSKEAGLKPAREALKLIEDWQHKLSSTTVGQLAFEIIDSTGYKDFLYRSKPDDLENITAGSRLSELFRTMQEFERIAIVPSALQYVEALPALQAAADESEDSTLDLSGQKVNVLTIHKSKGLEWPVVYIVDCTEGSFPLKESSRGLRLPEGLTKGQASEADEHMAEERRLMYVAMTRARDELILTHSLTGPGGAPRKPSRFLGEAFGREEFELHKPHGQVMTHNIGLYGQKSKRDVDIPIAMVDGDHVHLNVSQVDTYLSCPLEFYYRYVLAVPEEPSPSKQYGIIMHSLIEDINRGLMEEKPLTLTELEKRLDTAWPKAGYMSPRHRDRAYKQAKSTLKALRQRLIEENRVPIAIEEPFAFTVEDARVSISGRFDAVLPLGDGVEIVDYKTSANVDTAEKAKQRASGSQQLTFYALAWKLLRNEVPTLVTLDFIETGQKGSIKKTERGLAGALTRLQHVADGIRARDFPPGRDHRFCTHPLV